LIALRPHAAQQHHVAIPLPYRARYNRMSLNTRI
jgi:hypothetical protein